MKVTRNLRREIETIVKVEIICNFYGKLNRKEWRRGLLDEEAYKNSMNQE